VKGRNLNEVVELYMTEDNAPLSSYSLQEEEVEAIFVCPVRELLRVNREVDYAFTASGFDNHGQATELLVRKDSFPVNWNDYHYKMAILAGRYFKGESDLLF
jgi:hypothetical protein